MSDLAGLFESSSCEFAMNGIEDLLPEHVEVISINKYFGWYDPDFSGLDLLLHESGPDKPVITSETGAEDKTARKQGFELLRAFYTGMR